MSGDQHNQGCETACSCNGVPGRPDTHRTMCPHFLLGRREVAS